MTGSVHPLVSVIITCYNQEAFIREAIESVIKQTYTNWECLVIDDGSTDGTAAVCKELAAADNRIHYLYQQNSGVSIARNNGFIRSKGEYIQFLDGDDFLRPEKLQVQVHYMQANPGYAVTYTDHEHYWQSSGNYAHYTFNVVEEYPLEQLLFGYDRGVSIPIHSALLQRSTWSGDELPFATDYAYRYEDWLFWVSIALKQKRFRYIPEKLAVYRMHTTNFVSSSKDVAFHSLQCTFHISSRLNGDTQKRFLEDRIRFVLSRFGSEHLQQQSPRVLLQQLLQPVVQTCRKIMFRVNRFLKS